MGVDMTVDEVPWLVFVDKPVKTPETAMAQIFRIMDKAWRRMGDHQVDTLAAPEGET